MSILIKRLPEKKWEDITKEDVDNAIVYGNDREDTDEFYVEEAKETLLGKYVLCYTPAKRGSFNADRDSLTTLFAGDYASGACISGICESTENKTIEAIRTIAWDFIASTSGREYACNKLELERALARLGYKHVGWTERVGQLLMNMILGL